MEQLTYTMHRLAKVPESVFSRSPWSSPVVVIFLLLSLLVIATRIFTGLRSTLGRDNPQAPKEVGLVPYWIPWLGSALQFGLRTQRYIADIR